MKKLLFIAVLGSAIYACGPSGSAGNENSSTNGTASPSISASPTGDTAITDGGTGAAKGAESSNPTDSAQRQGGNQMPSDTTQRQ
jgi:hypothetical protein